MTQDQDERRVEGDVPPSPVDDAPPPAPVAEAVLGTIEPIDLVTGTQPVDEPASEPTGVLTAAEAAEVASLPAPALPSTAVAVATSRRGGRRAVVPGQQKPRQMKVGRVVSDKMDKTVIVVVEFTRLHPLYKKAMKRTSKFAAHDERNECKTGDVVRIEETRPLSKTKRWVVREVVQRRVVV